MAIRYKTATTQRSNPKFQDPGHYTPKDREKIKHFAGPNETYPVVVPGDITDAARLVGHAADPAAVKASIIRIAHELGPEFVAKLPNSWTADNQRADVPEVISMPFAKVLRIDEKNRLVTLRATTEATDTFRTAFAYEASKEAFQRWEQEAGNIREMHAPKAVGRSVQVDYDDRNRAIDVTLRISKGAQDTWEKIVDGTLQGGSIGASNVVWQVNQQRAIGAPEKIATKYDLVELSLVDNPSNAECRVLAIRSAHTTDILATLEETPMSNSTPTDSPMAGQSQRSSAANYYRNRLSDAQRVAAAGERAENEYRTTHPQQQHEQTSELIARVKAARGSAEANELLAIAQEKRAAEAPVQALATPSSDATRDMGTAVPMAAGVTTATGYQPHEMDAAVETHGAHEHRHRHSDGTVHAHPHVHDHGTEHRAAESDDAPHAEHIHVYQAGQVTDLRLTQTEETRAPASQMGSGDTMPKPTTGTTSVFDTATPANPVKHTKPSMVGHRVDWNSEDASAKDFGIPDPEDDRQTPGDDEEELTTPPDMFHADGKWPEHGTEEGGALTGGTYDFDGDHDEGSDTPVIASRPPAPTVPNPAKNRPTPGNRAAAPEETRVGARVSADSADTLHGIEDQGLGQIVKMCEHCGCDSCQQRVKAIMLIMNPAEAGDEDGDMAGGDEGDEDEMRVSMAAVTRQQNAMLTTMQRLASANEAIVRYLESQDHEAISKRLAAIEARLSRPQETRMQVAQSQQLEGITRAAVDTYQLVTRLASFVEGVAEQVDRIAAMPVGNVPAAAPLAEIKRLAMDRNTNASASNEERVKVLTDFSRNYTAQHQNDGTAQAVQMATFEEVFRATQGQR
jgi:hypothetical protein